MKKLLSFTILFLFSTLSFADGIYKQSANLEFDTAYKKVYESLESNRFWVIDEIDMGQSLSGFKDKWNDYNLNKIERIKIMIICNGWYANKVSNADPDMLALCPMRVTLTHKEGVSTALFAKPSTFAANSKALAILQEAEQGIIDSINSALAK